MKPYAARCADITKTTMAYRILLVDDEADILEFIRYNLEKEDYEVFTASNGREAVETALRVVPHLILLDVMMPKMDGLAVCRELERDAGTVRIPIIMLTARGEDVDRILGFELGADDYVVKPFNIRELLLRIRAILRRQVMVESNPVLSRHGVSVDPAAHRATVHGQDVELTATEFRLIEDLLRNAGRVRTREELLAAVWGYQFEGYARTVDTHIRRLRNKLGDAAEITIRLHNQNVELLEYYIDENLDLFDYYVITPHFPLDAASQKRVMKILARIPNRKLIMVDHWMEAHPGNYGAVYQDFANDAYEGLGYGLKKLKTYSKLNVVTLPSSLYYTSVSKAVEQFCRDNDIAVEFHTKITPEIIREKEVYLILNSQYDLGLV